MLPGKEPWKVMKKHLCFFPNDNVQNCSCKWSIFITYSMVGSMQKVFLRHLGDSDLEVALIIYGAKVMFLGPGLYTNQFI